MTLSVVIPCWSGTGELADMAYCLCRQVKPMCDQLVVTEDGNFSKELERIADVYLLHERLGHAKNLVTGIQASTGDFIALIDSDMEIQSGSLRDLCIPGKVVSPSSVQKRFDEVAGWFLVSPREYIIQFLPFDQASQALNEGIDVWTREFNDLHKEHFVSSDKLVVHHGYDQSYGVLHNQIRAKAAQEDPLHPRKEIDPQRHKQRLQEDPVYAAEWAVVI